MSFQERGGHGRIDLANASCITAHVPDKIPAADHWVFRTMPNDVKSVMDIGPKRTAARTWQRFLDTTPCGPLQAG
jgi:hypothetical protein